MIIDGKAIAAQIKASLQGSDAKLAVIMVGDDPASSVYVRNKERACAEVGIQSCSCRLPATASTEEVIASIAELSTWADGILVQLPLPEHIDEKKVLGAIPPEKDVDCFHPYNIGKLLTGGGGSQALHSGRNPSLAGRRKRETLRHCRAQQYRRQASCPHASACKCHRYRMPL